MTFLLRSLTDPLVWDNETIFMNVSVRGTYPGNVFDMTPYVQLSDTSDNFTSADLYQYRRSIKVSTTGWTPNLLQSPSHVQSCMILGRAFEGKDCSRCDMLC